jgi:dolichyl-diphosphooligosaccharide--protein glycosyltransferase
VENTVYNFPHRISFDPAALFPHGQSVGFAPFFDVLLAFVIWIIGLGSPTQHTIETVSVYFPAILGALTVIPVYMIGKEVFNRNAGLLAAALIAILPGVFLNRSVLGFSDHHVAEILFSTIAILFMILALKSAKKNGITFEHFLNRDWKNIKKPLIYTLLLGVMLGIYLLTWIGGVLLVLILFSYLVLQYLIDHLRGKSTDYLCIIGVPSFLISLLMIAPFVSSFYGSSFGKYIIVSLLAGIMIFLALSGASKLMNYRGIKRYYYPLGLAGLGVLAIVCFRLINPSLSGSLWDWFFNIFIPSGAEETISEATSIFLITGAFSWNLIRSYFGTGFFISIIAFITLAYAAIKEWNVEKTLLIVWSAIMLAATIGQARFAYYLAVNVALLTGYFSWKIVEIVRNVGFKELSAEPLTKKERKRRRLEERRRRKEQWDPFNLERFIRSNRTVRYALAAIIVFSLVLYPGIFKGKGDWHDSLFGKAVTTTKMYDGPNDDWYDSLVWLRDNTPEPYPDDFYHESYQRPSEGQYYVYPESAYGVMSWWDYGYWIIYIAHRIPNANPSSQSPVVARFFVAQDESSATEILNKLGAEYVIIDYKMATSKFWAMINLAGRSQSEFFDHYLDPSTGQVQTLYHPEYYRSISSRLYNFGGEAVVPTETRVVSYEDKIDLRGTKYREILPASKTFKTDDEGNSYEKAERYINEQGFSKYEIVGANRFISPVPLEELEHYKLIHESDSDAKVEIEHVKEIMIFEYTSD